MNSEEDANSIIQQRFKEVFHIDMWGFNQSVPVSIPGGVRGFQP